LLRKDEEIKKLNKQIMYVYNNSICCPHVLLLHTQLCILDYYNL